MWLNLVEKSVMLKSIFKDDVITLDYIELSKIEVDCLNGWNFKIHFNLSVFPSVPPLKWKNNNFNTVQVCLNLIENDIVFFQNSILDLVKAKIEITEHGDTKILTLKHISDETNILVLKCKWIYLNSVTGYIQ